MTSIQGSRVQPATNRLFFALWPDAVTRKRIAAQADTLFGNHPVKGRRIDTTRYHMTLRFLGDDVSEPLEAAAIKAASRIEAPPFNLRLDLAGSFLNPKIPIWIGTKEPPPELFFLDEAMRRAFGEKPRKKALSFKPHVTIQRDASEQLPEQVIPPLDWRVNEFVLIRSLLGRQPRYDVVHRYPLRGGPLPPEPEQFRLL